VLVLHVDKENTYLELNVYNFVHSNIGEIAQHICVSNVMQPA